MASSSPAIDPQIVSFTNPRRSFVLHNAKRKRVEVMYAGNMMTLPAVDEIHARKAAKDVDGDLIPGTYMIEDDYVFVPEFGDEFLILDSAKAVAHILGLRRGPDGKFTEASSPFAVGGISLLPKSATKEQWKAVAADGEKRAWLTEVKNAQQLIQDIDEKNAKRKAAGMEAVHGGRDWDRARALITEYNSLLQNDARKEISYSPIVSDALDDEVELAAIVRAKALDLSQTAGSGLDLEKQKQLFNELLDNPKVRQWAQKEMSFRRRGHLPIKDKDLEAAAALNAGIGETGLEEK